MKSLEINNLEVQELSMNEMQLTDGGVIFTAAVCIAIGGAFVTGLGVGVAIYAVTNQLEIAQQKEVVQNIGQPLLLCDVFIF